MKREKIGSPYKLFGTTLFSDPTIRFHFMMKMLLCCCILGSII